MTAREIIERLAYLKRVEQIIRNVAHTSRLAPELQDLAQMVYVALLRYDPEKIVDLWESDAMDYFIVRIVMNQYRSGDSTFRDTFHRKCVHYIELSDLSRKDEPSEEDEHRAVRAYCGLEALRRSIVSHPADQEGAEVVRSYREIRRDFAPDDTDPIFSTEEPRVRRLKEIIFLEIGQVDRMLILMYADCGSLRKLGEKIGVSHVTINHEIRRIRAEIIAKMDKI